MNKQCKALTTFLTVILANCLYAGFLDGLKKVGEGVVDVAGGVVDTTVNATTSTVQSVKQHTVFADPQTNVANVVQAVPAVTTTTAPVAAPVSTPTAAPAPVPTAVPTQASMATPASVTASAPQVTERKSPSAEDGDNSFEQQYKLAIDYLNSELFVRQLDELVKLDVDGKYYGEDARSGAYKKIEVMDYGLTGAVPTGKLPGLPGFCKKHVEVRMPDARKINEWKDVLQSNIERERQFMTQKAVENVVRKVAKEELEPRCDKYNRAMELAGKIYSSIRSDLGPHHPYVACEKAIWRTTHFGHGYEDGPDGIYCLYNLDGWKEDPVEGRKIFQSGQSRLTKEVADRWTAHVLGWLARNDVLLSRLNGAGVKETCSTFYAKTAGTNTVPFKVYRGISFGSLIGDVYGEMEKLAQNSGANSLEWCGKTLDMFLNGCSFSVTVKPHDIQFIFGAFAPHEVPVLTAMKMKFTQAAPSVDALVEKYGKMDGAKIERKSEVVKRVWPETEIGQFWKMVATTLEVKVKQNGGQGVGDALKRDVESIFTGHSKAITREMVRIDIGGVTVDVSEDPSTHSVSSIFFKDTLLAAKLMELCRNQKAAAKKSEAEAKAAAEKKAKSDSLNF